MATQKITREQWLQKAVTMFRPAMKKRGVELPPVQVSCSWPGGGDSAKRIGECWPRNASKAKINEIFVSPKIEDPAHVLSILAHELVHAVDDCKHGHRLEFAALGMQMGLEGKPTKMHLPDAVAQTWAEKMIAKHGAFPHRTLDKSKSPIKKQTARMLKCECAACGAVWRLTQKVVDMVQGEMSCPACHEEGAVTVGG